MHLKKFELFGFKSFADKTKLEFNSGITAIVGPNGCGKSNIADALRWVLGEQSARSMRSQKMNDLIFAGSTNRKGLKLAEVTITLADIQGALPIAQDEVSITRRVYQNGESESLINHKTCRLKDVQNLLLDSGLGKNSFSTFEQGKLDQVIHLLPKERRAIFEDAAGITRFLMRKKEALLKLEQTEQNIALIKASYREVGTVLASLQKQAKKALDYQEKSQLLELLEKTLLLSKYIQALQKSQEIQLLVQNQGVLLSEAEQQLRLWQSDWQAIKDTVEQAEKTLGKSKEDLYIIRNKREILIKDQENDQIRLKDALAREQKLLLTQKESSDKQILLEGQITEKESDQKALEKYLNSLSSLMHQKKEKLQQTESEVAKLREKVWKVQQEKNILIQNQNQIENQLVQSKVRLENSQERAEVLQKKCYEIEKSLTELEKHIGEKKQSLLQVGQIIEAKKASSQLNSQSLHNLSSEIVSHQAEMEILQRSMTEMRARLKVLLHLREELQGFSKGTKRLLQETKTTSSPLYQKIKALYECFAVEECDPLALSAIMRPYSQTIVVSSVKHLQEVLSFAKQQNIKDFSILCLEHISKDLCLPVPSSKLLLKKTDNQLARHFLHNVIVVDSSEQALEFTLESSCEIWTNEGSYIDPKGVIFYPVLGETNPFVRENEIKDLSQEIEEKEAKYSHLVEKQNQLQQKNREYLVEKEELLKCIRKEELKEAELNFSLKRAISDSEKTVKEKLHVEEESKSLCQNILQYTQFIEINKKTLSEAKNKVKECEDSQSTIHSLLEQHAVALKIEQKAFREQESEYQKNHDHNQKLIYSLHLLSMQKEECQKQQAQCSSEIKECRALQEKIGSAITERSVSLIDVENSLLSMQQMSKGAENALEEKKKEMKSLESKSESIHNRIKKEQKQHYSLENQLSHFQSIQNSAETELLERFQLSPDHMQDIPVQENLEQTEEQIRSLRKELDLFGAVNMTAIEECSEQEKREQFLSSQIEDLTSSKQELITIIDNLDQECRKIFKSTFEVIRQNFRKNFQILFNGGEADLQFTDTENVLEAGVEIIAKPPGKQMRSITLLSGGEKCLTALALLFAIFECKPAPFCILDEIDAPLDDSNIERFANVLKQFTKNVQFLIITHNKQTMSIAHKIFGVSMEEKGVSKVLSLSFDHRNEQGAPPLDPANGPVAPWNPVMVV